MEIQPIRTVDGDRTNITYYSDVRVDDKYRVGEVNGGWAVLREALNAEHGTVERDASGLHKIAVMTEHALLLAEAVDRVAALAPDDDESVKYRLGRSIARMEAAMSTPEMFGRVAIAQTHARRHSRPDGHPGHRVEPAGRNRRAADDGGAEYLFRLAVPTGIYGGTLEVFRNMIAQHALGLGRPHYSPSSRGPRDGRSPSTASSSRVSSEPRSWVNSTIWPKPSSCSSCRRSTIAGASADQPALVQPESRYAEAFLGERADRR